MSESMKPRITALELTLADTEYSHTLSASCRNFSFQLRTSDDLRFAFETGKVAGSTDPYSTLKTGQAFTSPEKMEINIDGLTIYFANANGSVVVEIVEWY